MPDFFYRLIQQNRELSSGVQPSTAPRFATGANLLDDLTREIVQEARDVGTLLTPEQLHQEALLEERPA